MSLHTDDFSNNLPARQTKTASFNGLSSFIKNLEKHFFSDTIVRENSPNGKQINLVVELTCNLSLMEMILHSSKGNWGTFNNSKYSLATELNALEEINKIPIDVSEFSLILKDTNIIINRLYNQSISEQLDTIFQNLKKHYMQLTKGNTKVPYEIFVAVFEEDFMQNEMALPQIKKTQNYSSYWALYFDFEEDAIIYDLNDSNFIYDDLYMLNE